MEYDRFKNHHVLFVIGMVTLLIALMLFGFSFYIFPFLIFDWAYDVPEFISHLRQGFIEAYSMTFRSASWLIWLIFIGLALLFGYTSYLISNRIDDALYQVSEETSLEKQPEVRSNLTETLWFGLKLAGLILLTFISVEVIRWLFVIPAPRTRF